MHDVVYVCTYREGEFGGERFFWLDARLGPLLQEIGKIIRRNYPGAEVYIKKLSTLEFEIQVTHDTEENERVTKIFKITKEFV